MVNIDGQVAGGFEAVRDAFAENFRDRGEVGAAFAAYHRGAKVVDLWGGEAQPGVPWREDTMAVVWSTTKGLTALVVQLLADRGELDVDARVVDYWPEFGVNGKEGITVLDVLTHGARLPYPPGYETVLTADSPEGWGDIAGLVALLEAAEPVSAQGEHGYHAITFGLLLGEIVRRATGRTIGELLRDEVAGPLGLDVSIGDPPHESRLAELVLTIPPPPDDPEVAAAMAEAVGPDGPTGRALLVGPNGLGEFARIGNSEAFRSAEYAAASAVSDARSLARLYGMLACGGAIDGVRIVSPESVAAHSAEQWRGTDGSLLSEKRYAMGYMLGGTAAEAFGPNPDAFGHPGMGGSVGFADPDAGVGFGYVMNHMVFEVAVDPRVRALADALYACL